MKRKWCRKARTCHLKAHTDESLFGQLQGESSGNLLQLAVGVILWVDFDAGFSASEGNVDAGTFERHQGREGFDFVLVHVVAVTNTCFGIVRALDDVDALSFSHFSISLLFNVWISFAASKSRT